MPKLSYKLVEPVAGFQRDEVLDVTAQFGDWHVYDVRLEPAAPTKAGSVELTWDDLRAVSELEPLSA